MTQREAEDRIRFQDAVIAESSKPSHEARKLAKLLCRHGKTYARLQEDACNGCGTYYNEPVDEYRRRREVFEHRLQRREQLLSARIRAIVGELGPGFGVTLGGDPRGCTVKLVMPSGIVNDFGREGFCVPTA